jgi:hypothetical protein
MGPRDRASAVPSATGRRTLATFGSAIVATCGTLSILAASARPVYTNGQRRLASRATNGHRILIGIQRSEPLAVAQLVAAPVVIQQVMMVTQQVMTRSCIDVENG